MLRRSDSQNDSWLFRLFGSRIQSYRLDATVAFDFNKDVKTEEQRLINLSDLKLSAIV